MQCKIRFSGHVVKPNWQFYENKQGAQMVMLRLVR